MRCQIVMRLQGQSASFHARAALLLDFMAGMHRKESENVVREADEL
jgi:hypothetical protein